VAWRLAISNGVAYHQPFGAAAAVQLQPAVRSTCVSISSMLKYLISETSGESNAGCQLAMAKAGRNET